MRTVSIKLILILGFAYWASGLGQFLHEKIEHGAAATAVRVSGKAFAGVPSPPHDDHDDCITCQNLKDLKVSPVAPPLAAPAFLELVETLSIPDWIAPFVQVVVFPTARAPPGEFPC